MQRSNASSLEPTSKHFVAKLGTLDPAVEERLQRWAAASCEEHALRRHGDGSVALYAVKSSAKTARQYQSLLRTLASHWKLPFGKLDRGWLSLLGEGEYRAAVGPQSPGLPGAAMPGGSSGGGACAAAAPVATGATSEERSPNEALHLAPAGAKIADARELKPRAVPLRGGMHLSRLSSGFDERSHGLLADTRAQSAF